jgi:hypothetical protein
MYKENHRTPREGNLAFLIMPCKESLSSSGYSIQFLAAGKIWTQKTAK